MHGEDLKFITYFSNNNLVTKKEFSKSETRNNSEILWFKFL